MATLPDTRFKELAAELFFEIERRFPNVVQEYNGRIMVCGPNVE
jgi:hypothetical protein